ncbi:hypothetical protein HYU22_05680 [Candidatus Woesearchaeota archaeon]|nr:hypothetical protein [Candidatus Woesearchaeota archaeon]
MLTLSFQTLEDYVTRRFSIVDEFKTVEKDLSDQLSAQRDFSTAGLLAAVPYDFSLRHHILKELLAGTELYQNGKGLKASAGKEKDIYSLKFTLEFAQPKVEEALSLMEELYQQHLSGDKNAWLMAMDPSQLELRKRATIVPGQGISALQKTAISASGFSMQEHSQNCDAFLSPNGMGSIQSYWEEYAPYFRRVRILSSQGAVTLALVSSSQPTAQRNYTLEVRLNETSRQNLEGVAQKASVLIASP